MIETTASLSRLFMVTIAVGSIGFRIATAADSLAGVSIALVPRSPVFAAEEVPQGAVAFTASIKNEGDRTIKVAYPSICLLADYKEGEMRQLADSHGKSEILLKITKPDSTEVILRDGTFAYFDPDNVPILTIPPNTAGTFHVGWFFQNARGRWENGGEATNVFLLRGRYKVRILLRNVFPKAALYNEATKGIDLIDVWTGEIESYQVAIEVK